MAGKVKVSIIIPTFNRAKELLTCLRSIAKQNYQDYEVIVVDDASTDNIEEVLEASGWLKKIIYKRNPRNLGVSVSKNVGVKASEGSYLWFLDSDTEVIRPGCLKFMVEYLEKNPKVGALGCEVTIDKGIKVIRQHYYFSNDETYPYGQRIVTNKADYLATCNCFTRRRILKKVGGFNEEYFYGYEDAELGRKIINLGYKNRIDYRAAVFHLRSTTTRTANYRMFFKNRIRFWIWNFPLKKIYVLPFVDIKNFLEGAIWSIKLSSKDIRGQKKSKAVFLLGKLGLFFEFLMGIFYGYLWNLIFLPKTLAMIKKRKAYV